MGGMSQDVPPPVQRKGSVAAPAQEAGGGDAFQLKPPPVSQVKAPRAPGFIERQVMGQGRYSTLFKASSFELFVPKNQVCCAIREGRGNQTSGIGAPGGPSHKLQRVLLCRLRGRCVRARTACQSFRWTGRCGVWHGATPLVHLTLSGPRSSHSPSPSRRHPYHLHRRRGRRGCRRRRRRRRDGTATTNNASTPWH